MHVRDPLRPACRGSERLGLSALRLGGAGAARAGPGLDAAGDAAAAEAGDLGGPRGSVRAVLVGRVGLGLPDRGGRRPCSRCCCSPACSPRGGPWWTCATGGGRSARPTSSGPGCSPSRSAASSWPSRRPTRRCRCFSPAGPWYLALAAVAAVLFALHNRRSPAPLVPHGAFSAAACLGCDRGQLLRRRRPDRGSRGHPDLRADHGRRRLPAQGRPRPRRVPGRPAGRARSWAAYSPSGSRPVWSPGSACCWPRSGSG